MIGKPIRAAGDVGAERKITMPLLPFFGEGRGMVCIGTPGIRRFIAEQQAAGAKPAIAAAVNRLDDEAPTQPDATQAPPESMDDAATIAEIRDCSEIVVSRISVSWNQMAAWLRRIEGLWRTP